MDNIYTEEMKLYDKVTEAALINLHGIGVRNNNKLNLGLIKDEDYAMKFFVEVANMLQFIAPETKVTINRPNIFSFIIFKLKNRHLANIKFDRDPMATSEFYDVVKFMDKEFRPQLQGDFFGKIYKTNFCRKEKK